MDRVRIELDGDDARVFESYEVKQDFLTAPAAFSVRLGSGQFTDALTRLYPPNTPYALYVNDVLQHTGKLDGYTPDDSGGATEVSLRGRDALAPLVDCHIEAERSFTNASYKQLAITCIEAAGIKGYSIVVDNAANRSAIAGVAVQKGSPQRVGRTVLAQIAPPPIGPPQVGERIGVTTVEPPTPPAPSAPAPKSDANAQRPMLKAKVGHTWYSFLKLELDRAGLVLFAGADENVFILTAPSAKQSPTYELVRQRGATRDTVNVLAAQHKHDTVRRYARYVVFGRGGGGKSGRTKVKGVFVDQEMVALGFTKVWCDVDDHAKSLAQAQFLARRRCAEDRRQGWSIVYTIQGHTLPSLLISGQRAVVAVDTTVRVRDEELGIVGDFWIEGVTFRGGQQGETTQITLMRPDDLVFGDPPS